jgi:PhnB protein
MEITPYLNFNGQCRNAFAFYAETLGGKIVGMMSHGESPMRDQVPAAWHDAILHARLEADGVALMGSDAPPDRYAPPNGFGVSVTVPTAAAARRIFTAFADGGRITMPFTETFWSPGFGMVTDRFGTPWLVNAAA